MELLSITLQFDSKEEQEFFENEVSLRVEEHEAH
mgnify:FL=1